MMVTCLKSKFRYVLKRLMCKEVIVNKLIRILYDLV
jgi:hypothetical protein